MNNKITKKMVSNRQKKKRLILSAFVMTLFMALFTQGAMAQTNVYMHTGSSTLVGNDVVKFYDSGGKSSGPAYYWERWFQRNEDFTYTFKPESGKKVKVTFKQFTAYTDNNSSQPAHAFIDPERRDWALRINTAELSFYDGLEAIPANLITTYTGSVLNEFSVIADGPMTIHFKSYGYREEGWEAEVQQVADYTLMAPAISFQACSDEVVINANNKGAKIYYLLDNEPDTDDPLQGAIEYQGPFAVDINTTIYAMVQLEIGEETYTSGYASLTFEKKDKTPTPGQPTITRTGNTITIEPAALEGDINETYEAWYKTEAEGIYVKYTAPIEWSTPGTTFYAITRAKTCSDKESSPVTLLFDKVQVPDPTVEFTDINATTGVGTVKINCPEGYVLSYTDNGTNPSPAGGTTNSITLTGVAPGTTIKAIAYKDDGEGGQDPNYKESSIVTLLCLPGGEGSGGVYNGADGGGVVILDDREKHSWSYYSDATQPIHSLKPADVKITYTGFGPNTMTTTDAADEPELFDGEVSSSMVAVNHDAPANQFIYFKTLENADETGMGGTNRYPYTMIPNPFQKRPTYSPNGKGVDGAVSKGNTREGTGNRSDLIVNNGTTTNDYIPFRGGYADYGTKGQFIIPSADLSQIGDGGTISALKFYSDATSTQNYFGTSVIVEVGEVTQSSFSSASSAAFVTTGLTTVYSGTTLSRAADGTMTITFANDYTYHGGNLLISIGGYGSSWVATSWYGVNASNMGVYGYNQSNYQSIPSTISSVENFAPKVQITYTSSGSGGSTGGTNCETEDFSGVTATGYSATGSLPDGWTNYATAGYTPHVSNNTSYSYISGLSGNYLLMTLNQSSTQSVYAWAPQYDNITSISFNYQYEDYTIGTLSVGYVSGSTFYTLENITASDNLVHAYSLSSNDITTINNNSGQLAFRYYGSTSSYFYSVGIDDVEICTSGGFWVKYDANGGEGTMTDSNSPYESGSTVTVLANSFTAPYGKVFSSWNTAADGSGTSYAAGATFTINANTTLYAQWVDDGQTRYNVFLADVTNGSLSITSPLNAGSGVAVGTTVRVTATPNLNYSFGTMTVTGNTTNESITVSLTGNIASFTMPDEDVTVYATFYDPSAIYRGFYAWRVKTLSSGLAIQDKASKKNYGVGDIIFADQEIEFVTDKTEGNEVEFEALWAQAYVREGTTSLSKTVSNGTGDYSNYQNAYERNFHVLTSSTTASNLQKSYPLTITSRYPNGNSAGGSLSAGSFTAAASTKFENISLGTSSSNTYTADNHDLIFGRGITGRVNYVRGLTNGSSSQYKTYGNLDYTLRVESGNINNLSFLAGYEHTDGENVTYGYINCNGASNLVIGVLGCDYDRALGENGNSNLDVSNPIYMAGGHVCLSNSANKTQKTFDLTVKSGKFVTYLNDNMGTGDSFESLYMSPIIPGQDYNCYPGERCLTIEGGVLASIAGGVDEQNQNSNNNGVRSLTLRMKGGLVKGAVYGGAAISPASGDRWMVFTGGTVKGWIGAGCNGTTAGSNVTTGGQTHGKSHVYVGGKTYVGGSATINGSEGGTVFGAGKGSGNLTTEPESGRMSFGTNVVIADETVIENNVYGGGNYGFALESTKLYIMGGTVQHSVFGGSNQNKGPKIDISMKGGTIAGNLYGGSNTSGAIADTAFVNVSGGTVTNVFGGGYGSATNMEKGTVVNVSGGTINNNVYGGGEEGTVTGNTHVNVSGGSMKDVYGAGKGATSQNALVSGQTFVNVTGGSVANVYGGGEAGDVMAGNGMGSSTTKVTYERVTSAPSDWSGTYLLVYQSSTTSTSGYAFNGTVDGGDGYSTSITISGGNTIESLGNAAELTIEKVSSSSTYYIKNGSNYLYGSTNNLNQNSSASGNTYQWSLAMSGNCVNMHTAAATGYQIYFNTTNSSATYYHHFYPTNNYSTNVYLYKRTETVIEEEEEIVNEIASTVTIDGATVSGDVFGGGKMGKTKGCTQVNVETGNVRGSVFGGALGEANKIFVAGQHTVNIMGGRVFGSVYGGSRNANDALVFTGYDANETKTNAIVNISGGQVDQQVYAAGYYGKTYGSVYAFIGKNAIMNAPHSEPSFGANNEEMYKATNLRLENNVWAGGDWGVFTSGSFGAPTVSGYSNIYVDGTGYNTESTSENDPSYMNIGGSLFGCGTSCDAGKAGRTIMVRKYGKALGGSKNENFNEPYSEASRTLYSIQRADSLILDDAHVNLTGHAQVNSLDATMKYGIYSFDKTVRLVNGSSLFLNAMASQIVDFWNASCEDVYDAEKEYTAVAYDQVAATPNKVRVNGGNYIEIYHDKMPVTTTSNGTTTTTYEPGYGMLNGFAYMMVAADVANSTCAYARPKNCQDTPIEAAYDNPEDGGWVSYDPDKNTFTIGAYANGAWTSLPTTYQTGGKDQMAYENHKNPDPQSKNGEKYFRIWRCGGDFSEREAVFNVKVDGTNTFGYVDVSVNLPAWRDASSYYAFQVTDDGNNTTIDYGSDVMMFNAAMKADNAWVYFQETPTPGTQVNGVNTAGQDKIKENPNVNFGLVAMAGQAMNGTPLIVCNESDHYLADTVNHHFGCADYEPNPQVTFRLTYHNTISTNMTWDPMYITLVQMDKTGAIKDVVKIICTINTYTSIDQTFTTQTYAIMNGLGAPTDEYVAKVVLPTFDIYDPTAENESQFRLMSVTFEPESGNDAVQTSWITRGGETIEGNWQSYDLNHFAMEIGAALNEDNTDGWNGSSTGMKDAKATIPTDGVLLGETGGREPFAFDFRLTYNGQKEFKLEDANNKPRLGMLTFTIEFDNVKLPTLDSSGNPVLDGEGNPTYHAGTKTLTIKVDVIRRGVGRAFYIDGQHGSNANDAQHPDQAVLALSTIYNRCGYLPGDVIYIVNAVDVESELEWSGTRYDNVHIYRYPGGHDLSKTQKKDTNGNPLYYDENNEETTEVTENPVWIIGVIEGNEDNEAYLGTLINVKNKGDMVIRDITLDGHMLDNGDDEGVTADTAMIAIASGGTLTLTTGTTLQYNSSATDGGAVVVNDGGKLMMNNNATLFKNETGGEGGGVYMLGTMIVSDSVQIDSNYYALGHDFSNVYLYSSTDPEVFDKVIQIGTTREDDDFGPLTSDARIGVTKALTADVDGYTRVLNVENSNDIGWLDTAYLSTPNAVVFHDGRRYQLVHYTDPKYLYWIGTWVTVQYWNPVYESDEVEGYDPNNFASELSNIDTPEKLAWLISYVNGLNGATAHPEAKATITDRINMDESIWVPIGTKNKPFTGTLNGNGNTVDGMRSPLVNTSMGMFGYTDGATIQNLVAEVAFDGDAVNKGSVIGTMNGGVLANVEAAGTLAGKDNTVNMGGLVGLSDKNAKIHSSFAVGTMTATIDTTVMGGLVGDNGGDLFNSYARAQMSDSNRMGGLVGVNHQNCTIENCYVYNPSGSPFAYTNEGSIRYCYTNQLNSDGGYVLNTSEVTPEPILEKHGTYAAPYLPHTFGYMYWDNTVSLAEGEEESEFVVDEIQYAGNKISTWPGLLSSLNQWVEDQNKTDGSYTRWFRPTTQYINNDLPVLGFPTANCLSTLDGKYLRYGPFDADAYSMYNAGENGGTTEDPASANSETVGVGNQAFGQDPQQPSNTGENSENGIDDLLHELTDKTGYVFVYDNAIDVEEVPGKNVLVFINEDVVLKQAPTAGEFINTTVGVSFDNSYKQAKDFFQNTLAYDWHMLSTPLADAPLGISYTDAEVNYWEGDNHSNQVADVQDSYLPNGTDNVGNWDLYCFYEPEYHWINLKRNSGSHYHYDENASGGHDQIIYENEETLEPGKGYLAAVNKDSYLLNQGTLNGPTNPVTVTLTKRSHDPGTEELGYNLLGNPYQAYLDLNEFININNSMVGESYWVYIAEENNYIAGNTEASDNTELPSATLHPHQGFFVLAKGDNQKVHFNYNTMASATPDPYSYFRGKKVNYPLVNLTVTNSNGNKDLAVVEFNRPSFGGSKKMQFVNNATFSLSSHMYNGNYSIVFTEKDTEKVPVHFKTKEDDTFTMTWQTMHGTFTNLMLVDNLTGVRTNMLTTDHYTFEGSVDDYASRFYLTFNVTGVEEFEDGGEDFAWFDGNEWIVTGKGQLDVIDMTGRVLQSRRVSGEQTRLHLDNVAAGVYMMRLSEGNKSKTQKIVIR